MEEVSRLKLIAARMCKTLPHIRAILRSCARSSSRNQRYLRAHVRLPHSSIRRTRGNKDTENRPEGERRKLIFLPRSSRGRVQCAQNDEIPLCFASLMWLFCILRLGSPRSPDSLRFMCGTCTIYLCERFSEVVECNFSPLSLFKLPIKRFNDRRLLLAPQFLCST